MTKIEATGENNIDAKESKDKWAVQLKRAQVANMLNPIKGGRDRYEYMFTIGKMLIES